MDKAAQLASRTTILREMLERTKSYEASNMAYIPDALVVTRECVTATKPKRQQKVAGRERRAFLVESCKQSTLERLCRAATFISGAILLGVGLTLASNLKAMVSSLLRLGQFLVCACP
jgi:hypothetical protein